MGQQMTVQTDHLPKQWQQMTYLTNLSPFPIDFGIRRYLRELLHRQRNENMHITTLVLFSCMEEAAHLFMLAKGFPNQMEPPQ